jgi:hypothetical protein
MPVAPGTPRGRRVLSNDRMEGFSDGVYGFAGTLLTLSLVVHPPGTPLQQVLHVWPSYLPRRRDDRQPTRACLLQPDLGPDERSVKPVLT